MCASIPSSYSHLWEEKKHRHKSLSLFSKDLRMHRSCGWQVLQMLKSQCEKPSTWGTYFTAFQLLNWNEMLRGTDSGNCCNVELSPVISLNSDLQRIIAKSCIYICTIPLALSLSDSEEWTKSQWFSCGEHITHVCVCVCVCVWGYVQCWEGIQFAVLNPGVQGQVLVKVSSWVCLLSVSYNNKWQSQ